VCVSKTLRKTLRSLGILSAGQFNAKPQRDKAAKVLFFFCPFAPLCLCVGIFQPQTDLLRLHRLLNHPNQRGGEFVHVHLIAHGSGELGEDLFGVVFFAVEAAVNDGIKPGIVCYGWYNVYMLQTVTLQFSEEMLRRFRRGAVVARKPFEQFLAERLAEAVPPLADEMPAEIQMELDKLESLDNEALQQLAHSHLSPEKQRAYSASLTKNQRGTLSPAEKEKLRALGDEARRLTLKKAHASLLLKWRGFPLSLPSIELE